MWPIRPISAYRPTAARKVGRKIGIIAALRLLYHGALPVTTAVFTGLHRIFSVFHCIFLPDVIKNKSILKKYTLDKEDL